MVSLKVDTGPELDARPPSVVHQGRLQTLQAEMSRRLDQVGKADLRQRQQLTTVGGRISGVAQGDVAYP